jgi:hypothetical protein
MYIYLLHLSINVLNEFIKLDYMCAVLVKDATYRPIISQIC